MTDYILLEDEAIKDYVKKLNWHLPLKIQGKSMGVLSELSPDKVDLLVTYKNECMENVVAILRKMGYPRNKKALFHPLRNEL